MSTTSTTNVIVKSECFERVFSKEEWHKMVSSRASELWKELGSPLGRDDEIWLEAESRVKDGIEGWLHHGPGCDF